MRNKQRNNRGNSRRRSPRRPDVEFITLTMPDGSRALYVSDIIRETDPPAVREGIVRRRILATTGQCPCGARNPFDPRRISTAVVMEVVRHETDCPATTENLARAMRAARGGAR